ncbi:MAG: glycoside hydrolase family 16 protein [Chloroflexota bacterium]
MSGCAGGGPTPSPSASEPTVAASASAPAPSPEAPTPTPRRTGPFEWVLTWSDEFDGPAGSPPDPASWEFALGDGSTNGIAGWGNAERQTYTNLTTNAATDGNGNLLITARKLDGAESCYYGPCEYSSARLLTRGMHEIQFGKIEARIKVPSGAGYWPAFWMLGTNVGQVGWPKSGEIDIMEYVGRLPTMVFGTIHGPGYYGTSGDSQTLDLGLPVADDFHTFSIEWQPDQIAWFVDGIQYHEASPEDVVPNVWAFNHPFYLLLNVAVGGNFGGPIAAETVFPQSMAVDYVRIYEEAPQ